MPKGSFLSDTFEQLAELGVSTAKQSGKAVQQTLSPTKLLEHAMGKDSTASDKGIEKLEKGQSQKQKSTPLNFNKLQQNYDSQDKAKADALRNRLFQLVKSGEQKAIDDNKRKEEEKKRAVVQEEQDKKRKIAQQKQQEQFAEIPHGKERKSIFSTKKVAKREQIEVKPSTGKQ